MINKDYKNAKIKKGSQAYKSYAIIYYAELLNFFNPELQLIDTESAMKKN